MKFKYIGNHDQITQHEITFKRNEPVEIGGRKIKFRKSVRTATGRVFEDRYIDVEQKLAGNPDFEEVIEFDGNEIIPKKRGPKPKVKHGNQAGYQEQSS